MSCVRAAWLIVLALPGIALAQGDGPRKEITFQIPAPALSPTFRVGNVNPSGEMTLVVEGPNAASMLAVEGYFLLMPLKAEAKDLARVLVTDVGDREVTVKTSPEAAKALGEGAMVRLVRPRTATTKQLKAIPERIVISDPKNGVDNVERAAREAAQRGQSVNHLKVIGLGLHNWHSAHGTLPPAVVRGADGKPMHSWRVLILPFIERMDIYKEYDFSQPWDSEKNLKLLDKMPAVYRDPADDGKSHFTHYAVVSGDATLFPPEGAKMKGDGTRGLELDSEGLVGFNMIHDGTSNTVAVTPVPASRKIPWTKPEDIRFDEDFPALGDAKGIGMPYEGSNGKIAPVLMMDGAVATLSIKANPAVVNALMTRAGGEIVPPDAFDAPFGGPARPGAVTLVITLDGGKATAVIR